MIDAVATAPVTPKRSPVAALLGVLSVAKVGLAGGAVSLLALALAGIAFAAGVDPAGACGGG